MYFLESNVKCNSIINETRKLVMGRKKFEGLNLIYLDYLSLIIALFKSEADLGSFESF